MIIKRSTIEKIRIEGIQESHSLDPVEVIVENFGEGAGKITVSCYGSVWSGFWGSMGCTVEEFFQLASNDYLIGKMSSYTPRVPNEDKDPEFLLGIVAYCRRTGEMTKEEAREASDYIKRNRPDRHSLCNGYTPEAISTIPGLECPWELDWPRKPCSNYKYLSDILDVVREVIKPGVKDES